MHCDVIIPALNEQPNIDALFAALAPQRDRLRCVIVADNGSTDGTAEAAQACGAVVVREPKRGYGAACLKAIEWIEHNITPPDVVVFLDADLSDDPDALASLLEPITNGRAELVIGSRTKHAEPGALSAVQRFGNALACTLMRQLTGRSYSDLGPFRAITWSALQHINMRDQTWGWTVEMQMKAAMLGVAFEEVAVPYRPRRSGRSKVSGTILGIVRAGGKILYTIAKLHSQRRRLPQHRNVHARPLRDITL